MTEVSDISGVGSKTSEKLEENGYQTIKSVAKTNPETLNQRTGLSEKKSKTIIDNAREHLATGGTRFSKGKKMKEQQNKLGKISTGSEKLDKLLGGGVPTNYTTEAFAEAGGGKTQLAHTLSVNVQKPVEEGGLNGKALFIDTENTFMPDRIEQIAEAAGMDPEQALDNIYVARSNDSDEQMELVDDASKLCAQDNIKLIVVDGLMSHFRAEYHGRGELGDRQDKLGTHLRNLQELAKTYDLAVYYTNQVLSDPGQMFGDPTKAIGGNVVAHSSAFRLYLSPRGKKGYSAKLVDSPNLPPGEIMYDIKEEGITDKE